MKDAIKPFEGTNHINGLADFDYDFLRQVIKNEGDENVQTGACTQKRLS
jgi:hypothetical protein